MNDLRNKPVYGIGDLIKYKTFAGKNCFAIVTERLSDIKNGRPGFDAVESNDEGRIIDGAVSIGGWVWGYDYQFIRVVKHSSSPTVA